MVVHLSRLVERSSWKRDKRRFALRLNSGQYLSQYIQFLYYRPYGLVSTLRHSTVTAHLSAFGASRARSSSRTSYPTGNILASNFAQSNVLEHFSFFQELQVATGRYHRPLHTWKFTGKFHLHGWCTISHAAWKGTQMPFSRRNFPFHAEWRKMHHEMYLSWPISGHVRWAMYRCWPTILKKEKSSIRYPCWSILPEMVIFGTVIHRNKTFNLNYSKVRE